jgi:protein TonB
MFDDFQSGTDPQSRKRLQRSLAAAFMIYGGSAAGLVAATATARHVVEEELQQVEFAATPEPEPPPPEPPPEAPQPKKAAAPKAKRQTIKPPDEVPLDKPKESDAPLVAAGDTGPVDGFTDGVEGGTGSGRAQPPPPPPPKKEEPLVRPVEAPSNEQPDYPKAALRKGIEGVVVVKLEILETGRIGKASIVSGPQEFHATVLEAVKRWRYKPAMRGGVPVRYTVTRNVRFRLEDA